MTPLDKALAAGREDPSKGEEFYNLFLNTSLFVPLIELPKENDPRTISPVLLEYEGVRYLPLFDEEARLGNWAQRQIPFAELDGYTILQVIDASILFVLNVGTDYPHQFVADELAWLRSAVQLAQ